MNDLHRGIMGIVLLAIMCWFVFYGVGFAFGTGWYAAQQSCVELPNLLARIFC